MPWALHTRHADPKISDVGGGMRDDDGWQSGKPLATGLIPGRSYAALLPDGGQSCRMGDGAMTGWSEP